MPSLNVRSAENRGAKTTDTGWYSVMEEHGLDGQRLDFFISMERFLEAAELEYAEGHLENAYRLCLKCGSREALILCTRSIVSESILSFPHSSLDTDQV